MVTSSPGATVAPEVSCLNRATSYRTSYKPSILMFSPSWTRSPAVTASATSSATSVPAELPDASGTMGLPTGCANAVAPVPMVMIAAMPRVAAVRAIYVVRIRKSIPHVSG